MRLTLLSLFLAVRLWGAYGYQRTITVTSSSTLLPATQTNFVMLVCANGTAPCDTSVAGLNQSGAGAHVTSASGHDIVFSTTACNSPTLMKWAVPKYVPSTGELVAYVEKASLALGDVFYMCYGDSGVTTFQGGTITQADTGYIGIWGFPDGSSLSALDYTSNANNGTVNGATASAGKIGGAMTVTADVAVNVSAAASTSLDNAGVSTSGQTWEFWYYGPTGQYIASKNSSNIGWVIGLNSSRPELYLRGSTGGNFTTGTGPVSANTWTHLAITWDGQNSATPCADGHVHYYLNGSSTPCYTFDAGYSGTYSSPGTMFLGNKATNYGATWSSAGTPTLDEFRISAAARDADHIKARYSNESAPGTFLATGAETVPGAGPTPVKRRRVIP